ncbi:MULTISPECIES: hypothetical protein [Bacillus cereus group]|uniref:Uncharacterized protein n=1 Tax=Bacillus cereus TaxID=1396 RepID=A0AA44Q9U5_BACCE|nr:MULTISPECIES: hypothetical protein [Bacillus cereus group]PFA22038.1 hypothetical protein CN373_11395 [Bacillus cereus]PFN09059.1 hypothetical protein COJ55_04570 [Bacillus cereus]PFO78979.1 hypothetical protein COJ77_20495 [Bacillus cereus]PFR29039.1 hypothetical protein COK19_07265 [Bacillus cereus]PFR99279.1 hypothetical protein COK38_16395 [Bacillus cereus]
MTTKISCDEILVYMYKMDDTEKLELLKVLSEKHFGGTKSAEEIRHLNIAMHEDKEDGNNVQTQRKVNTATKAYIEGYLGRQLTDEEITVLTLAYDWGHFAGSRR